MSSWGDSWGTSWGATWGSNNARRLTVFSHQQFKNMQTAQPFQVGIYFFKALSPFPDIEELEGGWKGRKRKRKRVTRKKKKVLTRAEIEGLRAIYDDIKDAKDLVETPTEIIQDIKDILEPIDIVTLEALELEAEKLKLGRMTPIEKYEELEDTEDITLILAIIESLD